MAIPLGSETLARSRQSPASSSQTVVPKTFHLSTNGVELQASTAEAGIIKAANIAAQRIHRAAIRNPFSDDIEEDLRTRGGKLQAVEGNRETSPPEGVRTRK
ncbi:hypothetical protein [Dokdonella ginsengisoli]|uniref:Uncharacterized protein n=1 Tax=Dokdonella ginsengisoli TaxID=363846 RepID=A0ABV9QUI4_9GAMM